ARGSFGCCSNCKRRSPSKKQRCPVVNPQATSLSNHPDWTAWKLAAHGFQISLTRFQFWRCWPLERNREFEFATPPNFALKRATGFMLSQRTCALLESLLKNIPMGFSYRDARDCVAALWTHSAIIGLRWPLLLPECSPKSPSSFRMLLAPRSPSRVFS